MVAMPDLPATFAATWVEPIANPVPTPDVETLAMLGSLTDQKTDASVIVRPEASATTTWSGSCAPIVIVDAGGVTPTVAISSVLPVSVTSPLHESTIAVPTHKDFRNIRCAASETCRPRDSTL